MNYEWAYATVACASIVGATVVGILLPGPWALLSLVFIAPIIVTVLVIRRRLNRG